MAEEGYERKVALRAARRRVDDHEERLAPRERIGRLGRHERVDVGGTEALLQRVEGEPSQLRLDEVRAIRHHGLESLVARAALPLRHEVQHVLALAGEARLAARAADQRHLQLREHGQPRDGVLDLEEARVEVELGREGGDADEGGHADEQQRRDGFIKEVLVHVGGLLEDDGIAARALRGA